MPNITYLYHIYFNLETEKKKQVLFELYYDVIKLKPIIFEDNDDLHTESSYFEISQDNTGISLHFWFSQNFVDNNSSQLIKFIEEVLKNDLVTYIRGYFSFIKNKNFHFINISMLIPRSGLEFINEMYKNRNKIHFRFQHQSKNTYFFINEIISDVIDEKTETEYQMGKWVRLITQDDKKINIINLNIHKVKDGLSLGLGYPKSFQVQMAIGSKKSLAKALSRLGEELKKLCFRMELIDSPKLPNKFTKQRLRKNKTKNKVKTNV